VTDPNNSSVERSGASSVDAENPWPGLAPFTEDQGAFFHGRDDEIDDLTQIARLRALVVLFGQSGLGKSSLLQAGVFPRLRAHGFCPVYIRLDHAETAPSPTEQIKSLVLAETSRMGAWTQPNAAKPGETLWELFHHRDDRLIGANGQPIIPVLVFDQFEELFTLGAAAGARRARAIAFMSELAELVENRPSEQLVARLEGSEEELHAFDFGRTDYRVIITLREDFLPELEGMKTIMPALMANRMRLARMTGRQALEAVLKPGAELVTEDVARTIVEFVAGARGGSAERLAELEVEPPLLSVICRELNDRRRALGHAQITPDLVTGNRREILTDFYERSVADLPEGMRRFVEDKLLTKSGFRDNLALETALEEPGVTRELIDTLVARRLLRIEDRIGTQRVELTHDVLADVVRASRDARQQRIALEGARLREQRAATDSARRTLRLRFAIGGLVLAVVALSVGAVFGIRTQRRSAQQSGLTDIVLGSRILDEGKLSEGLAYLVRAGRKDPMNPIVAPRLLTALTARNFMLPVGEPLALPSPATGGAFLAGNRWLWAQGEDDVVRLIDTEKWTVARELVFEVKVRRGGVTSPAKNADILAVVLEDNRIVVCETATGRPRIPPIVPAGKIAGRLPQFSFSPDGHWLAASGPNEIWVWNTATGDLRATLPSNTYYREFVFSPDSRKIATTDLRTTQMWSLADGTAMGNAIESGNRSRVVYPRFSADGSRLLIWNYDGALVCDAETGDPVRPLIPLNWLDVQSVWISPDGSRLLSTARNRAVNVLDVVTGKPAYPPLMHGGNVLVQTTTADGKILFTNSVDGLFRLWDLDTGKLLAEPTLKQPQYAPAAVSGDGQTVVMFSATGAAYRLQLGRGAAMPLGVPRTPETTQLVAFVPESPARLLWLTYSEAKAIDIASGRETKGGFPFPERVTALVRGSYGTALGAGDIVPVWKGDGTRRLWTLGTLGVAKDVVLEDPTEGRGFFDPVVQRMASMVFKDGQNALGVWDTQSGRRLATIPAADRIVPTGAGSSGFTRDGKRVAFLTSEDSTIHVCDISTGKEAFSVQLTGRGSLNALRFSPDGRRLWSGDTWGGVQVWDATNGKMLRSTQRHRSAVTRFDHSAKPRFYSSVSSDGSVQVWDAATDEPVGALLEQEGAAASADFNPDNTRIVTPSNRGSARVWDTLSGLPLTDPLLSGNDPVIVVAFSPDGRFIDVHGAAGLPRQTVRIWPAPPEGRGMRTPEWLLTLATICAGHRLTDDGGMVGATEALAKIEEVRHALASAAPNDPYAEWGRWLLSTDPTRPIAPGFTITPAEAKTLLEQRTAVADALASEVAALNALNAQVTALIQSENWPAVETGCRQLLERLEKLGLTSSRLQTNPANTSIRLAYALLKQGRFAEGEPVARKLSFQQAALDAANRAILGGLLLGQRKFAEAEPLLLSAYDNLKEVAAAPTTLIGRVSRETAAALAELYTATSQPAKAAEWKKISDAAAATAPAATKAGKKKQPTKAGQPKAP
jgi:WD40 repeat protein